MDISIVGDWDSLVTNSAENTKLAGHVAELRREAALVLRAGGAFVILKHDSGGTWAHYS